MMLSSATTALSPLASEGGQHASLEPYLIGGLTLAALCVLLWITTRLNRDR
jgi:energy-converting hydrogenase Eha subunit B